MTVLVVHTTETPAGTARSVARQLLARGSAPHQVYDPSDGTVVHCHDWNTPARALKNLAGGVETNRRGGVIQVEIIGYAAEVPFQSASWYANLGRYLNRVCDLTGTPKTFPLPFGGNETYGRTKPTRLSFAAWQTIAGIIGHQHVPENDHWDPGRLDVARLEPFLAPPVASQSVPIPPPIDYGSFDMATAHTQLVHIGPLDHSGNGWTYADFPSAPTRVVGVVAHDAHPLGDDMQPGGEGPNADRGYNPNRPPVYTAAVYAGRVLVTARGGVPGASYSFWITAA